ncbi:MAG: GGDEF domain-containing protein, partial [Xanthomonadaceae bacterium]|nr:GGDEF domain-containing protein [Xanthomonadaceae bacterium]
ELTEAVRCLDDAPVASKAPATPAPEAPTATADDARAVLLAVLDRLQPDEVLLAQLGTLRADIAAAAEPAALARQAEALAVAVNRHVRQLAEQRDAAETLLNHVTEQLLELTRYLSTENVEQREGSGSRQQLDQHLIKEIDALGTQMQQASDLRTLQAEVESRIGAISAHMKAFREREEARERDWQARAELMNKRIRELESAAHTMEASLSQTQQQASTDLLTGIANRMVYEQHIALVCDRVRDEAAESCLLVLDIDHFKQINDRFGHAAGDRALRIVSDQLKARLRADDLIARYGGEEFTVVLSATNGEAGLRVAETLRTCIETLSFRGQQQPVSITLSCGVTQLRPDDDPQRAFERADRALYQAKRSGRNRCAML